MPSLMMDTARRRRMFVGLAASGFILVAGLFGFLILKSIDTIKDTANRIDDTRAIGAAQGAVQALQKQLAGVVKDNATWDGAYARLNSLTREYWIIENWATTQENNLYDSAVVVSVRGKVIVAYKDGKPLNETPNEFFGVDFGKVVADAYQRDPTVPVPVTFIRSKSGIAIIGASTIRPSSATIRVEENNLYALIFAKHINASTIEQASENFRIEGLHLSGRMEAHNLSAPLVDVDGVAIAYLNWPSQFPGTKSFAAVRFQLAAACLVLLLFLAGIGIAGFVIIRNLRNGEASARYKAFHDGLTGIWNRAGLIEKLSESPAFAGECGGETQLYLIDLDGFKAVNDTWGHIVGDQLIIAVAKRLVADLPRNAFVARLGGDEFAVVYAADQLDTHDNLKISKLIQGAVSSIFEINGRTIQVGGSVGVSASRSAEIDVLELIRTADLALFRSKDLGRGMTVHYEPTLDSLKNGQAALEEELRRSLANEGVSVVFQPLIDAHDHSIRGVEALARWKSESRGDIGPDVFIPLAEKAGLIEQLGLQVLRQAIAQTAKWPGIDVSVNVSPLQLQDQGFVESVKATLTRASFDPSRLTLEITEGVLITNPDQAKRAIAGLKALGVKIALDDFGCGFASIGCLREFGFDRMKIDRSLVSALDHEENAAAIFQATIALANALSIPVTAEGIETEAHSLVALISGCDQLQGYLFNKPLSAAEISATYFGSSEAAAHA